MVLVILLQGDWALLFDDQMLFWPTHKEPQLYWLLHDENTDQLREAVGTAFATTLCAPMMMMLSTLVWTAYASAILNSCWTEAKLWVASPAINPDPRLQTFAQLLAKRHDGGTSSQSDKHVDSGTATSAVEL